MVKELQKKLQELVRQLSQELQQMQELQGPQELLLVPQEQP